MRIVLLIWLSIIFVTATKTNCRDEDKWGEAGQFDFYVFEQTWPAQFCYGKHLPGCTNYTDFMQRHFIIHGLWPEYQEPQYGHNWPQCCTNSYGPDVDPQVIAALWNDLLTYWPNLQDPHPKLEDLTTIWNHEWSRHGYQIGGLWEKQVQTPNIIGENIGRMVSKENIKLAYHRQVALRCNGKYLAAVRSCFTQTFQWMNCDEASVQDNCPLIIRIPSFSQIRMEEIEES